MNNRNLANILLILVVIAIVAGAAWYQTQRAAEPTPEAAVPATPAAEVAAVDEPPAPAGATAAAATASDLDQELPRLVDLGADKCKACKALAPILVALRKEYQGRVIVEFIDVWKNPAAKALYGVRVIPTQILYDREENEVWRHEGFVSKADLQALFAEKVGVK